MIQGEHSEERIYRQQDFLNHFISILAKQQGKKEPSNSTGRSGTGLARFSFEVFVREIFKRAKREGLVSPIQKKRLYLYTLAEIFSVIDFFENEIHQALNNVNRTKRNHYYETVCVNLETVSLLRTAFLPAQDRE